LAIAILAIAVIVFVAGLLRGEDILLMLLTAVSLAVAAIPEALPAVVTISLALGAKKLGRRHALMRRLSAVETLGSITYICADKTGTLTQNKMQVATICAYEHCSDNLLETPATSNLWRWLGQAMALCNDVTVEPDKKLIGDPTEIALYLAAQEAEYDKQRLEQHYPRIAELPFHADRRIMTTLHRFGDETIAFAKGAPEAVIPLCHNQLSSQGVTDIRQQTLLSQANQLAAQGYRVLAIAMRRFNSVPSKIVSEEIESELTLLGMVGLIDPPRPEVMQAITDCRTAGIMPVMITGDHPATAQVIAHELGIENHNGVLTGSDLDKLSEEAFEQQVLDITVYARVTPEQKIRIVTALQRRGEYVAMTGDGVNDAPALRRANIGVAMGRKGTDVAREASDMVLMDDNFATIVTAVREGRRIFDNIRKFIKYTMTSNSGEIWTIFLAPFLGLPLPLLPIQILWINLVTDGLPGLALSVEPQERHIMQRPPRPPSESIFAHGMWQHMIWVGLLIGGLSLGAQAWAYHAGSDNWQTVVFTVLTFSQLVHALVIRSERESLFTLGLFSNLSLLGTVILTVGLQLMVIYVPFFNHIFHTTPLSQSELLVCFVLPLFVFVAVEMEKWLVRQGWLYQISAKVA
jgi:Ca2+-transporting ATPase